MSMAKQTLGFFIIINFIPNLMSEEVPLQFEKLFPDSAYSNVYNECTKIWDIVRQAKNPCQQEYNEQIIDDLMTLHALIKKMLEEPHSCSPDDVEYLLGVLQIIQNNHARACQEHVDEKVICTSVLFDHLKKKLAKPLVEEEN